MTKCSKAAGSIDIPQRGANARSAFPGVSMPALPRRSRRPIANPRNVNVFCRRARGHGIVASPIGTAGAETETEALFAGLAARQRNPRSAGVPHAPGDQPEADPHADDDRPPQNDRPRPRRPRPQWRREPRSASSSAGISSASTASPFTCCATAPRPRTSRRRRSSAPFRRSRASTAAASRTPGFTGSRSTSPQPHPVAKDLARDPRHRRSAARRPPHDKRPETRRSRGVGATPGALSRAVLRASTS